MEQNGGDAHRGPGLPAHQGLAVLTCAQTLGGKALFLGTEDTPPLPVCLDPVAHRGGGQEI